MTAFAITTIVVCVFSLVLCMTPAFGLNRTLDELGRQGGFWFEHTDDLDIEQRPSEDTRDTPLPHRPLRGRW